MPFAFRSAEHAQHAMDGPLGAYLRAEMEANGIHGFPVGAFDNGMRQISIAPHPVVVPDDLIGIRMRTPAAPLIADTFKAFGAEPVTVNSDSIYAALKSGTVDAQENPLALIELFKLYEVARYISVTNHIWSGFNELVHLGTWKRLPDDIKAIIDRNVARHVRLQRSEQMAYNARLRTELGRRGRCSTMSIQRRSRKEKLHGLRDVEAAARHDLLVAAGAGGRAIVLSRDTPSDNFLRNLQFQAFLNLLGRVIKRAFFHTRGPFSMPTRSGLRAAAAIGLFIALVATVSHRAHSARQSSKSAQRDGQGDGGRGAGDTGVDGRMSGSGAIARLAASGAAGQMIAPGRAPLRRSFSAEFYRPARGRRSGRRRADRSARPAETSIAVDKHRLAHRRRHQ